MHIHELMNIQHTACHWP